MAPSDLAIPTLPSRSIGATVDFYKGFGFDGGPHASNQAYAVMRHGAIEIHFFEHPALDPAASSAGCYVRVQDVQSMHRAFASCRLLPTGIPRMESLQDQPWGLREFAVVDIDGNLLRIGQLIER